jgi:hypothetical protein
VIVPAQPPAITGGKGRLIVDGGRGHAALITHECVVDKADGYPLTVARVLPLSRQRERLQAQIRSRQQLASFYLPDDQGLLGEEYYIDLRLTTTVAAADLPNFRKIASLTDEARSALREQIALFWTRPGDQRN